MGSEKLDMMLRLGWTISGLLDCEVDYGNAVEGSLGLTEKVPGVGSGAPLLSGARGGNLREQTSNNLWALRSVR